MRLRPALAVLALLVFPGFALAHVVSMSNSYLKIEGSHGHLELRMPLYEIAHMKQPEEAIFAHLHFFSHGEEARLLKKSCQTRPADDSYVCEADYEFAGPVDRLRATCTLYQVTVPNHAHLLRVEEGDKSDRAVFDFSFTEADLRFVPPTPFEIAMEQIGAGIWQAVGGATQLLFLLAVAVAGRTRKETALLAAMLIAGVIVAALAIAGLRWYPSPRFLESAMALTVAYLAVEILLLPEAGFRWAVVAVLGAFHGAFYGLFMAGADYRPYWVLAGVALSSAAVIALFGWLLARLEKVLPGVPFRKAAAAVLLVTGLGWFFVRMRA